MSNETLTPPAEPTTPEPARPARIGRFAIGVNVLLQLAIFLAIVMAVNYLGFRHYKRWDFSRNQKYALSNLTKNVLTHLDSPVKAIVFFPQAQMMFEDVSSLLREYEYASGKKFTVEFVNPYRNLIRARELAEKYKFGASDNIVILDYKGKSKFVNAMDMAEMDMSGQMFGQPPTIKAFKGEEAVTSALMEITEEKQNKLYVLGGHGEPDLNGQELIDFKSYAERQNVKFLPLNLNNVDTIPADATGLIILGPKTDLSEREVKLVSDFWVEKKGRLFVLLHPGSKTPRLDEWLSSQGVHPQNDRVLKTGTVMVIDQATGQPAIRNGIISSPMAILTPAGKDVTKDLAGIDTQLYGATESLALDQTKSQTSAIRFTPLMESAEGYWGETEFVPGNTTQQVFFDANKDHKGPLTIAVAVEKGAMADPRVKVETARMIVVGNAGFVTGSGLRISEVGLDFALNGLNWMVNREQVAGIPPKPKDPMKLSLDEKKMNNLALTVMVLIPGVVGLIGLAVWWQRRS